MTPFFPTRQYSRDFQLTFASLTAIDLKQASKLFAQKFATGASVSKSAPGTGFTEEVVIQGDVAYDVEEMFEEAEKGGGGKGAALFKEIGDAVDIVEGKK